LSKIEVITQTEALYTLRVLSNNTDALVDEINLLARSSKAQFQHAPVILEIESRNFQANELAVLIEILSQNERNAARTKMTGVYKPCTLHHKCQRQSNTAQLL